MNQLSIALNAFICPVWIWCFLELSSYDYLVNFYPYEAALTEIMTKLSNIQLQQLHPQRGVEVDYFG